jgi:hypothetical protein
LHPEPQPVLNYGRPRDGSGLHQETAPRISWSFPAGGTNDV